MFTHHGTYIIGFSAASKHMAMAPERATMIRFEQIMRESDTGFGKIFARQPWNKSFNYKLSMPSFSTSSTRSGTSRHSGVHIHEHSTTNRHTQSQQVVQLVHVNRYALRVSPESGSVHRRRPSRTRQASLARRANPRGLGLPRLLRGGNGGP